jgi:hypothetical protein
MKAVDNGNVEYISITNMQITCKHCDAPVEFDESMVLMIFEEKDDAIFCASNKKWSCPVCGGCLTPFVFTRFDVTKEIAGIKNESI